MDNKDIKDIHTQNKEQHPQKIQNKPIEVSHQKKQKQQKQQKIYRPVYCLLGDIGGTNMRFSLCLIQPPHNQYLERVKKGKFLVKEQDNFVETIIKFLSDIPKQKYPQIIVMGVAGPVQQNIVSLSNVPKWGQLNGQKLQQKLKVRDFVFLNDFIANSYGLLLLPQSNFISLNGKQINIKQTRGVLGPGTGLGNSIIYSAPFRKRQRIYVLPSQGGHTDTYYLNDLNCQYLKFLANKIGHYYVGLEYSFCGPAIPYMYQFFASKYPTYQNAQKKPTSQEIITTYMSSDRQADTLQKKAVQHFLQLYCNAICNFIIHHMCTGGVYLVGSLTNAVIDRLKQINITQKFCQRHPQISNLINKVPIVVSKEVDLGLRGAYVYARRIIADEQHDSL